MIRDVGSLPLAKPGTQNIDFAQENVIYDGGVSQKRPTIVWRAHVPGTVLGALAGHSFDVS